MVSSFITKYLFLLVLENEKLEIMVLDCLGRVFLLHLHMPKEIKGQGRWR